MVKDVPQTLLIIYLFNGQRCRSLNAQRPDVWGWIDVWLHLIIIYSHSLTLAHTRFYTKVAAIKSKMIFRFFSSALNFIRRIFGSHEPRLFTPEYPPPFVRLDGTIPPYDDWNAAEVKAFWWARRAYENRYDEDPAKDPRWTRCKCVGVCETCGKRRWRRLIVFHTWARASLFIHDDAYRVLWY